MMTIFNRLGPYESVREIGRGGMAMVFLARDTRTHREVALKLVPHGTDREAREILEAEQWGAELQRQFSQISRHVPAVYEHRLDESGYFLVAMEYLDGENLSEVITRGPLPPDQAVDVATELCRFLECAHRFEAIISDRKLRSLVHGDLKPRNVRITSAGQVKVLDFGIAKALSLSRKVTRNDFGTMPYLSPERLDTGDVNELADLWAVGVMLYEMVRGTAPFWAQDTRRLEQLILARCPAPPLGEGCPVGLQAIVAKLLGPTPAGRYDSAQNVREDLERFTSGKPTQAEQEGWPRHAADEATRRTRTPIEGDDEKTRRTRPAAADAVPPVAASVANAATPVATRPRRPATKFRRLVRVVLILLVLGTLIDEIKVTVAASRAAEDFSTRELEQMGDAWNRYDSLARRSYLHIGTKVLERSLTRRTSTLAERVIADYRSPLPTVREKQWQMARDSLARAIGVSGNDSRLQAALRYCDGHLHRINGEAAMRRDETVVAQRHLTNAVAAFREAAELRQGWPDPFLGLARTFVYGLEDLDRGADALNEAQRYGYTPTDRETAQLADGYRARGNSLVRSARQLAGLPQETDFLTRAAEAYREALTLYSKAVSFADVPRNIRLTQRALSDVQLKLDELSRPLTEPAVPGDSPNVAPPSGSVRVGSPEGEHYERLESAGPWA
jgi:tRNA A-37 threonylcarbamoyl transferase component Bud32